MLELLKRNFGFGCMRLPMKDDEVDTEEMTKMVDTFMAEGFNYFDTAHGYLGGKSEKALKKCLVDRYPRESFVLTDKLSPWQFEKEEEILPLFEEIRSCCGVEYFDFFLCHAQNKEYFEKYKKCHAYEKLFELKREGKIKHVGLSFHDKAEVLDEILTTYPELEIVQIQLNYVDMEDPEVDSRRVHEVCLKHNKPVIIMEPVKGGALVNLPAVAAKELHALEGGSLASYAIRYAAGQENVVMVLSGMGNMQMMLDNLSYMKDFKPLDERESEAVKRACDIFRNQEIIACTGCRYCTEGCPQNIAIPEIFARVNNKKLGKADTAEPKGGRASECISCGVCETLCPQRLPIRELLLKAKELENE